MKDLSRHGLVFAATVALVALLPSSLFAQPRLTDVSPRGLQIGGTTRITLNGNGFTDGTRLFLPREFSVKKIESDAQKIVMDVELTAEQSSGILPIRVYNANGISNALAIGVEPARQMMFQDKIESLPSALTGRIGGGQILKTSFTAQQGTAISFDLESNRLGAQFKPVLRVYDGRGAQVTWSGPRADLNGDARCHFVAQQDDTFTIELHDVVYRAANNTLFRLKVGSFALMDWSFPIGVSRETTSQDFYFADRGAIGTMKVELTSSPFIGWHPFPTPSQAGWAGVATHVWVSGSPEFIEAQREGAQPMAAGQAPLGINGRLVDGETNDRYLVDVQPGRTYRFDVWAARVGSKLDGVLAVRQTDGKQLQQNDDRPNTSDPGFAVAIPAEVNQVVVDLSDLTRRGGDDYFYRIAVDDVTPGGYQLTLPDDRINISRDATTLVVVPITRNGYNGPIELDVSNWDLGEDVTVHGTRVPAGSDQALLAFTSIATTFQPRVSRLAANTPQMDVIPTTYATVPNQRWNAFSRWLQAEVAIASSRPAGINIAWKTPLQEQTFWLGGEFSQAFTLSRGDSRQGPVRVSLATTQQMLKKTVKVDNKDQVVDDIDRALRIAEAIELADGTSEASATLVIPNDLAGGEWGVALRAELLSDDKQRVRRSVATPPQFIRVDRAFTVALEGEATVTAKQGDTVTLTGQVARKEGFTGAVKLRVSGLPEGFTSEPVTLAADQSQFELQVIVPAAAEVKDNNGLRLTSLVQPGDSGPVLARGNDLVWNLKVTAATE